MPFDKSGKHHGNIQRAMASDKQSKSAGGDNSAAMSRHPPQSPDGADAGPHTTLHDHGDGTFHTETHDGQREEHPNLPHALAHLHGIHGDKFLDEEANEHGGGAPPQHGLGGY